MPVRLGELLIRHGDLTAEQRDEILAIQRDRRRPFGVLAEELFGVSPSAVERAWATQYAGEYAASAELVEPEDLIPEPEALRLIERRQAWQFGLLPLRFESDHLTACSTQTLLPRAMRFAGWRIALPVQFVLSTDEALSDALAQHYPMAGMDHEFIQMVASG